MLYSVISILAPTKELNPVTGAIGLRIGLEFMPELIIVIAFVVVGLATRDIRREAANKEHVQMSSRGERRTRAERRGSGVGLAEDVERN